MPDLSFLKDLIVILGVAVVVVILFHRFSLPAIAGFILSGILVGPEGFGLIDDAHQVEVLAEIGVALLLFGIGVELELSKLRRLWRLALAGGTLQVGLTSLTTFAVCIFAGIPLNSSVFVGFVVALSSTAIVLRGLQQRGEIDAPHGRLALGILVFQDFSVVPIMLIIPLLAGTDVTAGAFAGKLAASLGILAAAMVLAVLVVPRILRLVARTRQRQLFILTVFVICLGTAWLVTQSGTSLAIGAFLAGLVVAGSEYRHQALSDMIPFREVFASLFFVTVGMLLSPGAIFSNLIPIIIILAGILIGKSMIVAITALLLRMPLRVSLIAGFSLAQVGEFSLVLLYATKGMGMIEPTLENSIMSAAIVSMFITPFIMSFAPRLAASLRRFTWLEQRIVAATTQQAPEIVCKQGGHIIIAGYGFAGRELALALQEIRIPFVIVDLNIDNFRRATEETRCAVYGDITSERVLDELGITHASELVLLINDPGAAEHAIKVARHEAPQVFITVRTFYLLDIDPLLKAGANEVIPAEREAAVHVTAQVLKRHRVDIEDISQQALEIREHTEEQNR